MGISLGQNSYGKSRIRLLRVARHRDRHDIKELTLAIRFEGDFKTAHTVGDNTKILPTDTMKNTVYALAQQSPIESAEEFCRRLIDYFLGNNPQVVEVEVEAAEDLWARVQIDGSPHESAFTRTGSEKRIAMLKGTREHVSARAGIENLVVLKAAKSAFEGFIRDRYTTLKEDRDRILSTGIVATWLYGGTEVDFNLVWNGVRQTLLETFADHESLSLQHTLYAMGEAVLKKYPPISEIHLSLPNKHYLLVNLSPFGMENPSAVYLPIDEPHGLIEATVRRE